MIKLFNKTIFLSIQSLFYKYIRMIIPNSRLYSIPNTKQSTENIFNEFLDRKLQALLEPEINEDFDLIEKQSTAEESVCEYSKIKRLNSTVILVSTISDSDCKDYDAYKIKNINEFRLKAIKV